MIPSRTLRLLLCFLAFGTALMLFAALTVHRHDSKTIAANPMAIRAHFSIDYWLEHGYFRSGGFAARTTEKMPVYFHKTSTGVHQFTAYLAEKLYSTFTGRFSWRLLVLHNQIFAMLTAALLGLLAFRLARRMGASPLQALLLGFAFQAVQFTFPDTLMVYWELTRREIWLFIAAIFLLIEDRCVDGRTTARTFAQAVTVFFLAYAEYLATFAFLVTYAVVTLLFAETRATLKRLVLMCAVPFVVSFGVYAAQQTYVKMRYPEIPKVGSGFRLRTGLDGSSQYYIDHLDIAFKRDIARGNFPYHRPQLFRWPWLFFAGTAAVLVVLIAAIRGRVPRVVLLALLALLGTYLLYAAVFSQSLVVHPYLYDVQLFTPLTLALFVVVPLLVEMRAKQQGIAVAVALILAVWVSMAQMRNYALRYPTEPPKITG